MDPGTLAALSIFRSERHPSLMGIGAAKEGFSVFGLLNRCATQMVRRGKRRAGTRCGLTAANEMKHRRSHACAHAAGSWCGPL